MLTIRKTLLVAAALAICPAFAMAQPGSNAADPAAVTTSQSAPVMKASTTGAKAKIATASHQSKSHKHRVAKARKANRTVRLAKHSMKTAKTAKAAKTASAEQKGAPSTVGK